MQAPGLRRLVSTTVRAVPGRLRRSTLAARRQDRRLDGCHLGPKWPMARVAGTDRARCQSVRIYGEKWVVVAGPCTCVGRSWLGWTRSGEGGLAVCLGLGLRRTLRSRRSVGLLCWVPSRAWVLGSLAARTTPIAGRARHTHRIAHVYPYRTHPGSHTQHRTSLLYKMFIRLAIGMELDVVRTLSPSLPVSLPLMHAVRCSHWLLAVCLSRSAFPLSRSVVRKRRAAYVRSQNFVLPLPLPQPAPLHVP